MVVYRHASRSNYVVVCDTWVESMQNIRVIISESIPEDVVLVFP